jgi:DNA-binding transcriptional MocR family regulator
MKCPEVCDWREDHGCEEIGVARDNQDKGGAVISFARGNPPTEAFPIEQLKECAQIVLERDGSLVLQYHPAAGFVPLRSWLAERHRVSAENVLVGNGSLQILDFVSRLLARPGDVVFVERPTYDRAITLFRRAGLQVVGVPLGSDGPDLETLENLLSGQKPRFFYVIPDFQNPTGTTTSLAKREQLAKFAERHDFWIVEDAPYRDLRYRGEEIPTIFSLGSDRVLHLSSFSKVLSPGMRVGYVIGPDHVISKLTKVAEDTYVTPNMLSQGIVYEYCSRGWLGPNVERLKGLYQARVEALADALDTSLPQAEWTKPDGGFFTAAYLPPEVDMSLLRAMAAEEEVILSDGRGFFPEGDDAAFLRLPFCALSAEDIREGIGILASVFKMLTN